MDDVWVSSGSTTTDTAGCNYFNRWYPTVRLSNALCRYLSPESSRNYSRQYEAMINPVAAACTGDDLDEAFIPDTVHLLENPGLGDALSEATTVIETILEQYGVEDPTVETTRIDHETEFSEIVSHYQSAIQAAHEAEANVAVDVTPGRKFMSVIAFNAGTTFDADHIFYFYLKSSDYYSRVYPEIPKPATDLYDFTEVL